MDFIFMLTRSDQTVEDCLELLNLIRPVGLKHIGFKDVGVEPPVLARLVEGIRAAGAVSYLEVVSATPEAALRSVKLGRELGVDRILGGTDAGRALEILAGSASRYYPFPGLPHGHPTQLGGTPEQVERQCREFIAKGCAGVDILAYRATEADPIELVKASRRGIGKEGYLIVAGSVTSIDRIRAVSEAGADAFTIGTAVFDGSYSPRKGSILSQLEAVLDDCRAAA
ncbi:MAG: 4-hydroxythreonine-4-phosphate dehydrogenase [Parvibaculaceae bacterium]